MKLTEVPVKEKPIVFSGPMVRALLEDRKTKTRRVMQPQPVMDADLTGAYIPVDPQEWTAENCPLIREQTTKHPSWGKPEIYPDGSCLGYGCGPNDDEPHELCKKCSIYAGKEEETL